MIEKCKKCGCDALIKDGDWYTCPKCGTKMFDTQVGDGNSATKEIEKKEAAQTAKKEKNSKVKETVDFFLPIVIAVVIALLLKTFVFANVIVPTGSMISTINEKDRIIASRLAYINDDPERYDIIVFKFPDDETQNFVKRVIGLPGETVNVKDGKVYVTKADKTTIKLDDSFVKNCVPTGNFGPYKVPEDSYFVMGDNRNVSYDSRYWKNTFVKKEKIIGKVKFRYFPFNNAGKLE